MAPYPANEAQRLDALHQAHILDTQPEEAFDDLTRLAAHLCGVPIAAVSLIDSDRQWFKSILGLEVRETPAARLSAAIQFCKRICLLFRMPPQMSALPKILLSPAIRTSASTLECRF